MNEAMNRKRARYAREQQKKDKHGIVDLTGLNSNNIQAPAGSDGEGVKTLRATVNGRNNQPVFTTVKEDKGGLNMIEDEYEKYDSMWDGFADQQIINSGATIISSTLEITDSSGRNRTLVRRNNNEYY
jgi:hypothetical protein